MKTLLLVVVLLALLAGNARAEPRLLVQTSHAERAQAFGVLVNHGARLVSPRLDIWAGPERAMEQAVVELRELGVLRAVSRNRTLGGRSRRSALVDPLLAQEWWRKKIGADKRSPPGPGVP